MVRSPELFLSFLTAARDLAVIRMVLDPTTDPEPCTPES